LKEKTKAYVAGMLDAEGCISISNTYQLRVKISNKNRKLMKYLVHHFGGIFKKVPNNDGWIYNWYTQGNKHTQRFLSNILPYLRIKLKEANLALEYCFLEGQYCPEKRQTFYENMEKLKDRSVETNTQEFSKNNLTNAYYAGLIDGEGDFNISQNFPRKRPNPAYYGYVRCKNTFKPIIDLMPDLYNGGLSTRYKNHPKWSPQRIWRLDRKEYLELFLLKIIPYLIIKEDQAKLLLNLLRLETGPQDIKKAEMYKEMIRLNNRE